MNEYFLVFVLKELAGSVKVLYRSIAFSSEINSRSVTKSLPNDSPNPKNMILNCCSISLCILDSDVLQQLRIMFFGFGLSLGNDLVTLRELVSDEKAIDLYRTFTDPASSFNTRTKKYSL